MKTSRILAVFGVGEALTGLALVGVPSLTGRLLLGAELSGVAVPIARSFGFALIALGIACWPGRTLLDGALAYGAAITLYLGYLGIGGHWAGALLWPAVAGHAVLTLLLARAWFSDSRGKEGNAR